jgi:hypothetical protein
VDAISRQLSRKTAIARQNGYAIPKYRKASLASNRAKVAGASLVDTEKGLESLEEYFPR